MHKTGKGRAGEQYAAQVLEKAGMRILASNFRSPAGEVDLVAQDGDTIVFIEVKTWAKQGIFDLEYGIGHKKQQRIIETAKYFLMVHREYNGMTVRFDVVLVEGIPCPAALPQRGPEICHLASAFMEYV
ncbi:MAG: YraN family protein [Treponema sp.]|jgi:putative endonuclease|nr:YraN family protein [Treponema sp.]